MPKNQFQQQSNFRDRDPRMGRFVLLSSIVHLLVALFFFDVFDSPPSPPKRPVYYVDLSQLPVADPRAGRPDGQKEKEPAAAVKPSPPPAAAKPTPAPPPAPKAPPAPPKPAAPTVTRKPAAPKPAAPKPPAPKAAAEPKPAEPPKPAVKNSGADYDKAMSAVEKMRRDREMAELKNKLAALSSKDSRTGGASTAPLGMPDGTGSEDGISQELWLQERLTENWSLSKYQVTSRDLVAVVRLSYNAEGQLTRKEFVPPSGSGDRTFDDSVTNAILKSRQLEFQPGKPLNVTVTFNLKDLME